MGIEVLEAFTRSKSGEATGGDDAVFLSESHAAVLDGETDKSGLTFDGKSAGRFIADVACSAIADLKPDCTAVEAVREISSSVDAELRGRGFQGRRPSATAVIYSAVRREIWRVGDASFRFGDKESIGGKLIDRIAAEARSALIAARLLAGSEPDSILQDDPGREMILPLLIDSVHFRNLPTSSVSSLRFGAIDGSPVPDDLIEVVAVPIESSTVILASDGYPRLLPTLAESEAYLKGAIDRDPLCIRELQGTKAIVMGADSYDDRTYLRLGVRLDTAT